QRRASDQGAIDVLASEQARGFVGLDVAAVEDAGLLGELGGLRGEAGADHGVDLLRLLGAGDLAGADGPDGLVGDDALARLVGEESEEGVELPADDLERLAALSLVEGLTDADDGDEALAHRVTDLVGDELVVLPEEVAPLA